MQTTPWRCNIVEILAAVVAQRVIGHHTLGSNLDLVYPFSRIITTKLLWQIAARAVSNKGKVSTGSRCVPPLIV